MTEIAGLNPQFTNQPVALLSAARAGPGARESRESISHGTDDAWRQKAEQLAALTELIARVESCATPQDACQTFVDVVCRYLHCDQAIVVLRPVESSTPQPLVVSGTTNPNQQSEAMQRAAAVLSEAMLRGGVSTWPALADLPRHGLMATT